MSPPSHCTPNSSLVILTRLSVPKGFYLKKLSLAWYDTAFILPVSCEYTQFVCLFVTLDTFKARYRLYCKKAYLGLHNIYKYLFHTSNHSIAQQPHTILQPTQSIRSIPSNTIQYHSIPFNTIQYHPIPSNTIQYHPISSNTIQYHPIHSRNNLGLVP